MPNYYWEGIGNLLGAATAERIYKEVYRNKKSKSVKICAICGYPIYWDDLKIMSMPKKGKMIYVHPQCIGGAKHGKTQAGY